LVGGGFRDCGAVSGLRRAAVECWMRRCPACRRRG
jgi:hypothetical protein